MEGLRFQPIPIDYPAPQRKLAPIELDPSLNTKGMDVRIGAGAVALPSISNKNSTAKTGKPVRAKATNLHGLRAYSFRDTTFNGEWVDTDHNMIIVEPPYYGFVGEYECDPQTVRSARLGLY